MVQPQNFKSLHIDIIHCNLESIRSLFISRTFFLTFLYLKSLRFVLTVFRVLNLILIIITYLNSYSVANKLTIPIMYSTRISHTRQSFSPIHSKISASLWGGLLLDTVVALRTPLFKATKRYSDGSPNRDSIILGTSELGICQG